MKKIISLLSALAIFSSMAVTGFALEGKTAANSNPKVTAEVVSVDEGYARINFVLENNETLKTFVAGSAGKTTYYGINAIQVKVTYSEEVFNLNENWPMTTVSGGNADKAGFVYAPTAPNAYMYEVPEVLFYTDIELNDGYTIDNIPSDAITFGYCMVEYQGCNNARNYDSYTRYALNAPSTVTVDYPLVCTFGDEEEGGEDDDTATAMAAGVTVTKGVYAGMTSASTDKVAAADLAKIVISNDKDTSKTLTWNAPATLGEGKSNVLAVLLYDAAAMKDSTFTVKFLGAADALIKAFTHIVE